MDLFFNVSTGCSRIVTRTYSTSFYLGVSLLHPLVRQHVFNIYGFVRLADEIVDSFHSFDRRRLLAEFKSDTFLSIERGISLNPILNSFQLTVNKFSMDQKLITAFFASMEMDLERRDYNSTSLKEYVYGSAEVVGLMCLTVFTAGDRKHFSDLKSSASALGSAFQKINFLRDIRYDQSIDRDYIGNVLRAEVKIEIEREVDRELREALAGIKKLPSTSQLGVLVAYQYYSALFNRIKRASPQALLAKRIRVPNAIKYAILVKLIFARWTLLVKGPRHAAPIH